MAQQPAVQPVPPRLQRGGRVPHFHVTDTSAARVAYDEAIWQRDHLLLVSLGDDDGDPFAAIARDLQGRASDIAALEARLVVTRDPIAGVPRPGAVVADRWGEVFAVIDEAGSTYADDLIEWIRWVQMKCPECEGEAY